MRLAGSPAHAGSMPVLEFRREGAQAKPAAERQQAQEEEVQEEGPQQESREQRMLRLASAVEAGDGHFTVHGRKVTIAFDGLLTEEIAADFMDPLLGGDWRESAIFHVSACAGVLMRVWVCECGCGCQHG